MGVDYAQNLYSSTTFTGYQQMRFTPGVSYKLNDMFSFGLTLNGMWATTEWNVASAFGQAPHMARLGLRHRRHRRRQGEAHRDAHHRRWPSRPTSFFQDFAYNTAPANP